jgi:hypothetical protein
MVARTAVIVDRSARVIVSAGMAEVVFVFISFNFNGEGGSGNGVRYLDGDEIEMFREEVGEEGGEAKEDERFGVVVALSPTAFSSVVSNASHNKNSCLSSCHKIRRGTVMA